MSMDTTTEEPRRVCYVVSNELVKVGPEYLYQPHADKG